MQKMAIFFKPERVLSHDAFVRHPVEKHGPLFRSIPEPQVHCRRYIQTHPICIVTDAVTNADFDGTVEVWFDGEAGMGAVLDSDTYKNEVFPDETTLLDHEKTLVLVGEQVEIISDHREG